MTCQRHIDVESGFLTSKSDSSYLSKGKGALAMGGLVSKGMNGGYWHALREGSHDHSQVQLVAVIGEF